MWRRTGVRRYGKHLGRMLYVCWLSVDGSIRYVFQIAHIPASTVFTKTVK